MNAEATAPRELGLGRPSGAEAVAVAAVGFGLLLLRPFAIQPGAMHVWLGVLALAALGALALASPTGDVPSLTRAALPGPVVLGIGMVALAGARVAAGPALPARADLAVILLNTLAAVAEEAFFRRFLYTRLIRWGAVTAVAGSALAFALVHVPAYGVAAFWVDLGAGLLLSWQRWACGNWGVPAATHAAANLLAVVP